MIPYWEIKKIGFFNTWGLFLVLGFLVPFLFVLKKVKEEKFLFTAVWDLFLYILAGSFLGMRLGYVLQFAGEYWAQPLSIFYVWDGGLTFYGGLLGGITSLLLFGKKTKLNKDKLLHLFDIIALYFPLGIITARIGCFLINDHQGAVTSLPWGILWPDGQIRHPVALYLVLNGIFLLLLLNLLKNRIKEKGILFYFFLFFYGFFRFFLDFTRSRGTDFSDPQYGGLFYSQWFSLLVAFVFLGKIISKIIKKAPKTIMMSAKLKQNGKKAVEK